MNLDDRLREHLASEAEGLRVPDGAWETARRRGRRRRLGAVLGAAALVLSVVAGTAVAVSLLGGGDGDDGADLVTTEQASTRTTIAAADDSSGPRPLGASGQETVPATELAELAFTWTSAELGSFEGWVAGVAAVADGYVVLGSHWDESGPGVAVWHSSDGLTWGRITPEGISDGASVNSLHLTATGLVAVGEIVDPEAEFVRQPASVVWTSADGRRWTEARLDPGLGESEHFWASAAAAGDPGIVVLGTIDRSPPEPAVVVSRDGLTLTVDNNTYTYAVTRDADGALLVEGSLNDFYRGSGDNEVAVRDEAGNVIVAVPPELIDETLGSGDDPAVMEIDGIRVTISHTPFGEEGDDVASAPSFIAESIETGEVLAEGSLDDLFRGPPPRLTDPATGDVVFALSWSEFDRAQQEAYEGWERLHEEFDYSSRVVAFHSTDGVEWTRHDVTPDEPGARAHVTAAAYGPAGFLAVGDSFAIRGSGSEGSSVWRSVDGHTWSQTTASVADGWVHRLAGTPSGYLAVGEGPDGSSAWSSADGETWVLAFTAGRGARAYANLDQIASGGLGTVVAGMREHFPPEPVIELSEDGMVLRADSNVYEWTITDAATGEVLATGSLDDIWGEQQEGVNVRNQDGEVVAVIPWDAFESAWAESYEAGLGEPSELVLEHDGVRLTVTNPTEADEFAGSFVAEDMATGAVINQGTLDELYRPPPPEFVDPATGEVLLAITWDEFDRAQEAAYADYEYDYESEFRSEPLLYLSEDGSEWFIVPVGGDSLTYIQSVAVGDGEVILAGVRETFVAELAEAGSDGVVTEVTAAEPSTPLVLVGRPAG